MQAFIHRQSKNRGHHALRQRSVTELGDDLRVMARRHPGAFMAGAAVAGFCLARFLRASARRGEYHS